MTIRAKQIRAALFVLLLIVGTAGELAAQASVRGDKALQAGDYVKAIEALEAATQKKNNGWCHNSFLLAYAYYQHKQPAESLTRFDKLFGEGEELSCYDNGLVPAWHYWRGRAAYDLGRYADAASSFAKAGEIAPVSLPPDFWPQWKLRTLQPIKAHCYNWLGSSVYATGAYPEAAAAFRKAVELDPKDPWNYSWLAQTAIALKGYDEALTAAKKAVELKPDVISFRVLGDVHEARGELDAGIAAFRKGLEIEPKHQDLLENLGQALLASGDAAGAWTAFAKEAELYPGDPAPLFSMAGVKARQGLFDEALVPLDQAIGMMTGVNYGIHYHFNNGMLMVGRDVPGDPGVAGGAKEAGLKTGDRILKIDGQPTKGWTAESEAFKKVLREGGEGATITLTVARDGEPAPFERAVVKKMRTVVAAASYLGYRSLVYRELGNREAALKDAALCLALSPGNISGLEAQGALDLDAGRFAEALKSLAGLKDDPFARLLEATAHARLGDTAKAVEIYGAIPETELEKASAFRQNARTALLKELQPHAQQALDAARAAESAGRTAEALDGYAIAIRISDETTAALIRQRVAILLKTNPAAAELPEEARKFALRGDVLIKEGSFGEALAEYRSALRIAPLNPQLHFNTALIHGQLRAYRAAIRSMTIYLQLAPDAANARAAKDEIYKWEFMLEKAGTK